MTQGETTQPGSLPGQLAAPPERPRVFLVGGPSIIRRAIAILLEDRGIRVAGEGCGGAALAATEQPTASICDAVVLVLSGAGAFSTFHDVRDLLATCGGDTPLVVLADTLSRGQIYTVLRLGAKAYVYMDTDPSELVEAIRQAVDNKAYLSPEAAALLVNDIRDVGSADGTARPLAVDLSGREVEIVQLVCDGLSSKEVALRLHVSHKTVENHRHNIYRKCGVETMAGLIRHAIRHGIVSL